VPIGVCIIVAVWWELSRVKHLVQHFWSFLTGKLLMVSVCCLCQAEAMRTPRAHRWMHELICYVLFRYEPASVLYMYQDINSFERSRFVVIPSAVIRISVMLSGYYELLTSSVSLSITSEVTTLWQDRSAFELRFITIWQSKDRTAAYCKWQNSIYFCFLITVIITTVQLWVLRHS